ncbi:capsule assembly Wzi family protein [bacterium]|nr:capsule assembly Wzi family protein [bacterium]
MRCSLGLRPRSRGCSVTLRVPERGSLATLDAGVLRTLELRCAERSSRAPKADTRSDAEGGGTHAAPRIAGRLTHLLILALLALAVMLPQTARAQAEHVDITHPVYHFLQRMELRGAIEGYSRAMLPLERKQVTAFVRELQGSTVRMSGAERALLARFVDEFVAEDDGTQDAYVLFETSPGDVVPDFFDDREKFLYRWRCEDGTSRFFAEFLGSLEYRTLHGDDQASNVTLGTIGGRFRGTMGGTVGFSLMATNGTAAGNRSLALNDASLKRNFNFADLDKDFFDFAEAYITASWDWGAVSLGREKRLVGNGISNQLLLSTNAQPFDALQFTAHAGNLRFLFLHGFLLSEKQLIEGGSRPFFDSKYVAMHRVEADIASAVRLGVFEAVVYSQREVDPAYLNPINFYKSAEHAGGDRDNPMLGFDLATLFIPGSQLYGSWLIDDIDFTLWGSEWWGNKFIWQGGVLNSSLLPNTDIGVEYTRIEPYVYTHRLAGNQYTHNGDALGLELAPNSDEWYLSLRHWLSAELWLQLELHRRRHGRNEVDADGAILVNHGGDIYESLDYARDSQTAPFLDGPLDQSTILSLTLRYEPVRNLILRSTLRYRDITSELDGDKSDVYGALLLAVEL